MTTKDSARRGPFYDETAMAALVAVDRIVQAEGSGIPRQDEHEWDAVHDAALDSFPASDAPSWGTLRVGAPRSYRYAPAAVG